VPPAEPEHIVRRADLALGVVATLVTIATWTAFIGGSRALAARSL